MTVVGLELQSPNDLAPLIEKMKHYHFMGLPWTTNLNSFNF